MIRKITDIWKDLVTWKDDEPGEDIDQDFEEEEVGQGISKNA